MDSWTRLSIVNSIRRCIQVRKMTTIPLNSSCSFRVYKCWGKKPTHIHILPSCHTHITYIHDSGLVCFKHTYTVLCSLQPDSSLWTRRIRIVFSSSLPKIMRVCPQTSSVRSFVFRWICHILLHCTFTWISNNFFCSNCCATKCVECSCPDGWTLKGRRRENKTGTVDVTSETTTWWGQVACTWPGHRSQIMRPLHIQWWT